MGAVNTFCEWVTLLAIPYQPDSFITFFAGIVPQLRTFSCITVHWGVH